MRQSDEPGPAGTLEHGPLYVLLLGEGVVRQPRLRDQHVAVVLHLREHWGADAGEVLRSLTVTVVHVGTLEAVHHGSSAVRLTAHRLLARRRLRKNIPLGHARCLRLKPRALTGRATPVHAEDLTLTFRTPVPSRDPRRTVPQFTWRYKRPGTIQRSRSDEAGSGSEFT